MLVEFTYKPFDYEFQDLTCCWSVIKAVESSIEWNLLLYMNFVDYEKAFHSVDRRTLWKLLRHYGVPKKIIALIKNSYEVVWCRVVHGGQLTDCFQVSTGVDKAVCFPCFCSSWSSTGS
ncbi:hypothetical protein QQF64_010614 [Cirrhinus molitorella]|uniref:Reverse transcriptase domain-containing protein n=1 Tax=Cirrhinus molitorella TaxID=172907 RepID=A0ABR3LXV1_9TELE